MGLESILQIKQGAFLMQKGHKMTMFIKYFMIEWRKFPSFKWFCESRHLKWKGKDPKEQYRNRFDYAFRNAKIRYAHKDRYSKKCTGDCENCKLKHC